MFCIDNLVLITCRAEKFIQELRDVHDLKKGVEELLTPNVYVVLEIRSCTFEATGKLVSSNLEVKIVFFNQIHKVHFPLGEFLKIFRIDP